MTAVLAAVACGWQLRFGRAHLGAFVNYDAAGITYNAEAILRGELPYRDVAEMKPPGPFVIAAAVLATAGRSLHALAVAANLWMIAAGLVLFDLARRLYGAGPALLALALFSVYTPNLDKIDFNYETWLALPYVASAYFAWRAAKTGAPWHFAASGACATAAGLMRHQGVFGLAVPLAMALCAAPRGRRAAWVIAGAITGGGPLLVWYAAHGATGELVRGLVLSEWGWRYVGDIPFAEKIARTREGLGGALQYLGIPLVLAASSAMGGLLVPHQVGRRALFVVVWLAASFAGTAVGFRFYQSYYMQLAAPLILAAAHPAGPIGALFAGSWVTLRRRAIWALAALTLAAAAPVARADYKTAIRQQHARRRPRDGTPARIGRAIRRATRPGDPIFCWGRHAWAVYWYSARHSPSPIYKATGVLTTPNTDSLRRPSRPIRFLPSPQADAFLRTMRETPPAWLVLDGSPWRTWPAFRQLVRDGYQRDARLSRPGIDVYRRTSLPARR
ncbi:MAG: glycosyltransferase family 39 protein [Myxococcota bacterium]